MASLFALKLARVVEGPATGVRAQDSRPRKARNQPVTIVEKRLDLFARNVDVVGVSDVDVGGAEDADGVHRNEDVTISGGCQPVHHRARKLLTAPTRDGKQGKAAKCIMLEQMRSLWQHR